MLGTLLKGAGARDASLEGAPRYAMAAMHLSLLREKIIVRAADGPPGEGAAQILARALSNRLEMTLTTGDFSETFVVRAHTMHLTARMTAAILREFQARGFLAHRLHDHQWARMWQDSCGPYDVAHNPERWCTIYHDGAAIFSSDPVNPLISAVEGQQARAEASTGYEQAIFLVQDAFEQAGKSAQIEYDSNIGLVAALAPEQGRCSLILRGSGRSTTFNFTTTPRPGGPPRITMSECLVGCAAFLEGIQLAFTAGRLLGQMDRGEFPRVGGEAKIVAAARRRLTDLNRDIGTMEALMAVRYRPERPEFQHLIVEVQQQTRRAPGARRRP